MFVQRCGNYLKDPPDADWSGVTQIDGEVTAGAPPNQGGRGSPCHLHHEVAVARQGSRTVITTASSEDATVLLTLANSLFS